MTISKKEGSPFYYTRFTVSHNGKSVRVQESTKCRHAAEAKLYEAKRQLEVENELKHGLKRPRTWEEATNRWMDEKKDAKRTIDQDEQKFGYINKFFKDKYLSDITDENIEEVAKDIEKEGHTGSTVNRTLSLIKSIFMIAKNQWRWVDTVPYIRMRPENDPRHRYLKDWNEAKRLIDAAADHLKPRIEFSLATGLRKRNVLMCSWDWISFDQRSITVPKRLFKTGRHLLTDFFVFPLSDWAIQILKKQQGKHEKWVFPYKEDFSKECNTSAWETALEKAGIEDFRWNDLRHTFAAWFLKAGGNLFELSKLLGHKSVKVTEKHYAHLCPSILSETVNRLRIPELV